MLEQILDFISIGKYIVIAIGIIGAILLIVGVVRSERTLITRGGYMLILSIIMWVCAHFIISTTVDRANQIIENTYIEYQQ